MVTPDEWHAAVRAHQDECRRYSKTEEYRRKLAAHKTDLAALGISSSSPDEMYRKMMEDFKRRQSAQSA